MQKRNAACGIGMRMRMPNAGSGSTGANDLFCIRILNCILNSEFCISPDPHHLSPPQLPDGMGALLERRVERQQVEFRLAPIAGAAERLQ